MKTLSIDVETFSSVPIAGSGVYPYAEASDFEVLLFSYSVDGGPVLTVDLARGETIPTDVEAALSDPRVTKWAFNANFERVCLSHHLGSWLDPKGWKCTMVWAATLGLPLSLDGVAKALKIEQQKLSTGKALIRRFCAPVKPSKANGMKERNRAEDDPQRWSEFVEYNVRDVEVELGIQSRLSKFPVPETVWEEYWLDQRINDRGILVDLDLVDQAIKTDEDHRSVVLADAKALTGLDNPNSVTQLLGWLRDQGCLVPSLAKADVSVALETAEGAVAEALQLRQELARSSVKKYQAMDKVAGTDRRARGLFQFMGANRTGRWAGRLIQLQNLPRNYLTDLDVARQLVRDGEGEMLGVLYDSLPDTLSQLIRTTFIPKPGCRLIVADYSAIEARVIAWLAGEQWRLDLFKDGGDIYCQSASLMFKVPVEKHGANSELRQKGKISELACIAEGQLVLTDQGLLPIEEITTAHRVWDGEGWVRHEGLIYRGVKNVIEYQGLVATPDHLVWVDGEPRPIPFGDAAASGAHLVQTGDGGIPVRLGGDHLGGKTLDRNLEPLLRADEVHGMRLQAVADPQQPNPRSVERVSDLFATQTSPSVAGPATDSRKATLRKPKRYELRELWRSRHRVPVRLSDRSGTLDDGSLPRTESKNGNRPNQQRRPLREGEPSVSHTFRERQQQEGRGPIEVGSALLALRSKRRNSKTVLGNVAAGNNRRRLVSSDRAPEKLAYYRGAARVYDLRNAGRHHRFTVSDRLVHNCGYGGSVGALKAMGALEQGLEEAELQPLVDAWRAANPHIVRLWWAVDEAVKTALREGMVTSVGPLRFAVDAGMLFIQLPSGRHLAYVKPRMGTNKFGGESVTYLGVGSTRQWERLESYGPKFVENIVQAISRDILAEAMARLEASGHQIVMHVHDEVVVEAPPFVTVEEVCGLMSVTPAWAEGLPLAADGFEATYYKKED